MARGRPQSEGRRVSDVVPLGCGFSWGVRVLFGLGRLVVSVDNHGGGRHRPSFAGARFVGLVAEDIAQVGDPQSIRFRLAFAAASGDSGTSSTRLVSSGKDRASRL